VLCCVRFVYVSDGNIIARVLSPVLARSDVAVPIQQSCCVRSLFW